MRHSHDLNPFRDEWCKRHCRRFLQMMQAIDGHAGRSRQLTTLKELRLINFTHAPCTTIKESGCSAGLFDAVRTLRVSINRLIRMPPSRIARFFVLFRKLECLHWDRIPYLWQPYFQRLCNRLNELHLCHGQWITGAEVGAKGHSEVVLHDTRRVLDNLDVPYMKVCHEKIRTLVTFYELCPSDLPNVAKYCPNLEYFPLFFTAKHVWKLRRLINKCKRLTGLEVLVDEFDYEKLRKDDWRALGEAIPHSHPKLSEVAIQMWKKRAVIGSPIDDVVDCFAEVVKRVGRRAQRLVVRVGLKTGIWSRICNAVCDILDTCTDHSWLLKVLEVEIVPRNGSTIAEDPEGYTCVTSAAAEVERRGRVFATLFEQDKPWDDASLVK